MQLVTTDLERLIDIVYDLCGITLDESKGYLVEGRLERVAIQHGCASYEELIKMVAQASAAGLRSDVVDAITTHETLFFRDMSPFDALKFKVLPEIFDKACAGGGRPRVRIWSAACSSGQEAYSIAMTMLELAPEAENWDIQILGTDVAEATIERARFGEYTDLEIGRGLPREMLDKWFEPVEKGYRVKDRLRSLVNFEVGNLLKTPPSVPSGFDVAFCRNVAIYFNPTDRCRAFENVKQSLSETGYLFAGASENLSDLGPEFRPETHCRSVFYRPKSPAGVAGALH